MGKSEATVRRMVRSGKLPAHLENVAPWGPTWVVNETDVWRFLYPDQPLVEVMPPDAATPTQMLKDVREGLTTLRDVIRAGDQGIRDELQAQHEAWHSELQSLRREIHDLRGELAARKSRNWWPWGKR